MARVMQATDPRVEQPVLDIALSERNLLILLSKLYTPGSACAITVGDVPDGFAHALLRAEPDDYHYAFPTREGAPAGEMHPLAETVRAAVKLLLADVAPIDGRDTSSPRQSRDPVERGD